MTLSKDDIQASGCSEQLYLQVGSMLKKKKIIFYIRVEEDDRLLSCMGARFCGLCPSSSVSSAPRRSGSHSVNCSSLLVSPAFKCYDFIDGGGKATIAIMAVPAENSTNEVPNPH